MSQARKKSRRSFINFKCPRFSTCHQGSLLSRLTIFHVSKKFILSSLRRLSDFHLLMLRFLSAVATIRSLPPEPLARFVENVEGDDDLCNVLLSSRDFRDAFLPVFIRRRFRVRTHLITHSAWSPRIARYLTPSSARPCVAHSTYVTNAQGYRRPRDNRDSAMRFSAHKSLGDGSTFVESVP